MTPLINSLAPWRCSVNQNKSIISEHMVQLKFMSIICEIALKWMLWNTFDDQVNIGSGNGLVPWGTKPLPEPMLTHILITMLPHFAT